MDTISPILLKLSIAAAKLLAKRCFRGQLSLDAISEDLAGTGIESIKDALDRKRTERLFQGYGEKIARTLRSRFEKEAGTPGSIRIKRILTLLNKTLESQVTADALLANNLDASRVADSLRSRVDGLSKLTRDEQSVFNDSFDETIRYIITLADELPSFSPTATARFLRQLDNLEGVADKILHTVMRIERAGGSTSYARYEKDYRQAVIRRFDVMELFGADIAVESRRHSLSVAYVSLHVEGNVSGSNHSQETGQTITIEELLHELTRGSKRLLIRGEAGSGKSTLFRWIAVRAAETMASAERGPTSWREFVPFLLRLRDCLHGKLPDPEDFPSVIARELSRPPEGWVRSVLRDGRAIILLDGVDEIPNTARATLQDEIIGIVKTYRKNIFIISTRPLAVPVDWMKRFAFDEARINPMSPVDRCQFITRWHQAVRSELEIIGHQTDLAPVAEELVETLANTPGVARLATNPLLCAMICALHRDRGKRLPDDQADLCEALCQMLLHRRESESQLSESVAAEPYRQLRYEQKRLLVQRIAYHMVLAGISTISRDVVEAKIGEVLKSLPNSSADDSSIICTCLIERCGMMREVKPLYLDFIHNTFKEFLAAEVFAVENDIDCLGSHMLDADWQPVIQFSVTTRRANFANNMIVRILDESELAGSAGSKPAKRGLLMLALRCRSMALQLDGSIKSRLDELAHSLFPPQSRSDAETLSTLGDIAVPFLGYKKRIQIEKCINSIHSLKLIGTRKAVSLLHAYRGDLREGVYTELASAIHPLYIDAVIQLLRGGQSLPARIASQVTDLDPLNGTDHFQHLDLRGTSITRINGLYTSKSLKTLILRDLKIDDISVVAQFPLLEWLDLRGTSVEDISVIANLKKLRVIDLIDVEFISLLPLVNLTELEEIRVSFSKHGAQNVNQDILKNIRYY